MPAELGHGHVRVDQWTQSLELEQEVEVEGEFVTLVQTTHLLPSLGTDQHAWLGDEIRSPPENSRSPGTGTTGPQFTARLIDVGARAEGDRGMWILGQYPRRFGQ